MEVKAWDAIGWDDGKFKIKGGRAIYEAVLYNCTTSREKVKIARLEADGQRIREVSRYVDPDTILVFDDSEYAAFREMQ